MWEAKFGISFCKIFEKLISLQIFSSGSIWSLTICLIASSYLAFIKNGHLPSKTNMNSNFKQKF